MRPMKPREIADKIINKEPLFILDVRNEGDFQDWKIDGETVEAVNFPYFELIDSVEPVLGKIPKKDVLVVCAKEGSSKFVAEQLDEAGIENVSYLEGGMRAWSEYLHPVKVGDLSDGGALYQFVRLGKGCLSYMVESDGKAMIIDTNRMIDQYESFAKEKDLDIIHTADTHLHADHISGGRVLAEKNDASYWLPPKDATEVTFEYEALEEGKDIVVGKQKIKVQPIYSPGHTIGSTSFIIDNKYLLTGDILFIESIGRPDLAGKAEDWVSDLRTTLYERYKELSDELIVLPAHFGKISEVGEKGLVAEKLGTLYSENAGLQVKDENEFRRLVTENLPPQPNAYKEIRETNMGKVKPDEQEQSEMEIGPNRCAVHDN